MNIAWGEIAYESYREHSGGKSLVSGASIPEWEALSPEIRSAWEASAKGVRQTCINLIGMEHGEPVNEKWAGLDTRDATALRADFERRCADLASTLGLPAFPLEPLNPGSQVRWEIVLEGRERSYSIVAVPAETEQSSYVGCIMRRLDGERGRDCADGPYEEKTWNAIHADIHSYETHGVRADMRRPECHAQAEPGTKG